MNNRTCNNLIIISFVIFAVVLFWIVFASPFNRQMNGLIVILDCLSVLLAANYLTYRKEINNK
jgi:hypothetical protein